METFMTRIALLVAVSLAAFSSAASAQGTPEERSACRSDVRRLCAKAGGDQFEVLSCLQTHRTRLSKSCKNVLVSHGQLS
jgi:Cysteine rich repeat